MVNRTRIIETERTELNQNPTKTNIEFIGSVIMY